MTILGFLANKTPMIPQYFIARHFNNRLNLWIRLVVGEFYIFILYFVIRSKMKIEDIKEANKALQVQ